MRDRVAALWRNPISQFGTALVMVSGTLIVTLLSIEFFGTEGHPYLGILTYVILPTVFAGGLILMAWGVIRERRRTKDTSFPVIDLNIPRVRRRLITFLLFLALCSVVLATSTFKAVEFMEGVGFCGEVCHTVMEPEYVAFLDSAHANTHCVDCHVGPGAGGFIKAKLNGSVQLAEVLLGNYPTPVPTPVHNLPSGSTTCEECHWPQKDHGVTPKMITRFMADEPNTETKTILLLNVGGHDHQKFYGIHWHADPDLRIRYRADERHEFMHEVELTLADGTVKRYFSAGEAGTGPGTWRTMDCSDCHNRTGHGFLGAEEAIDLSLDRGLIARNLPFVKREAVRALRAGYVSREEARARIPETLARFYADEYRALKAMRADDIREAGRVLVSLYERNVFPLMQVDWGTYPDHMGHRTSTGCFRCHGGNLATAEGETISVDCRVCHAVVARDDASPEILELIEGGPPSVGVDKR